MCFYIDVLLLFVVNKDVPGTVQSHALFPSYYPYWTEAYFDTATPNILTYEKNILSTGSDLCWAFWIVIWIYRILLRRMENMDCGWVFVLVCFRTDHGGDLG